MLKYLLNIQLLKKNKFIFKLIRIIYKNNSSNFLKHIINLPILFLQSNNDQNGLFIVLLIISGASACLAKVFFGKAKDTQEIIDSKPKIVHKSEKTNIDVIESGDIFFSDEKMYYIYTYSAYFCVGISLLCLGYLFFKSHESQDSSSSKSNSSESITSLSPGGSTENVYIDLPSNINTISNKSVVISDGSILLSNKSTVINSTMNQPSISHTVSDLEIQNGLSDDLSDEAKREFLEMQIENDLHVEFEEICDKYSEKTLTETDVTELKSLYQKLTKIYTDPKDIGNKTYKEKFEGINETINSISLDPNYSYLFTDFIISSSSDNTFLLHDVSNSESEKKLSDPLESIEQSKDQSILLIILLEFFTFINAYIEFLFS